MRIFVFNFFIVLFFISNPTKSFADEIKKIDISSYSLINLGSQKLENLPSANQENSIFVIDFWASWCKTCEKMMKFVHDSINDSPKVKYFTISLDEDLEAALGYFNRLEKPLQILKNQTYFDKETKLASELKVGSLPCIVIINVKSKEVIFKVEGNFGEKESKKFNELISASAK